MKNLLVKCSFLALFLSSVLSVTAQTAMFDIYPRAWTGDPIPYKTFRVSPAMPNGSTTIVSGLTFAEIKVSSSCPKFGSACFQRNKSYLIDEGSGCFNRLVIVFNNAYTTANKPSIIFSERYDGNEGFQVSGGSNFSYYLAPRTSMYPCG